VQRPSAAPGAALDWAAVDDYETAFRRAKKAWEQLDNAWQRRQQNTPDGLSALREMTEAITDLWRITLPDDDPSRPSSAGVSR
jgi:hypothetical protein